MQVNVTNKEILLELLQKNSSHIKSFGVKKLGLFGSFARNMAIHKESDIDLLVEFEKDKKSYDNFMDLSFYLEELLNRRVELVTAQSLSKFIGPHIIKQLQDVRL